MIEHLYLILICYTLWLFVGFYFGVKTILRDEDFTVAHIPIAVGCSILGPIMILVYILGGYETNKVIIKKRGKQKEKN